MIASAMVSAPPLTLGDLTRRGAFGPLTRRQG